MLILPGQNGIYAASIYIYKFLKKLEAKNTRIMNINTRMINVHTNIELVTELLYNKKFVAQRAFIYNKFDLDGKNSVIKKVRS